jgi:hypothetical protein
MLTAKQRRALPASAYAYPKTRRYPIDSVERARSALSRAGQSSTRGSYQHVAKAVRRSRHGEKIGTVSKSRGTVTHAGYRKSTRGKRR